MFWSIFPWCRYLAPRNDDPPATTLSEDGAGGQLCSAAVQPWGHSGHSAEHPWDVLWQQRQPAAPKLCNQGYSSKVKGRDCPPLCGTRQTASKYRVQFWDLALERHGQTGGSSREGPQSGRAGHLPHEETLGKLDWVSWEKGCLWGTWESLAPPKGHGRDGVGLLTMVQDGRARSNGPRLEWERFRLSIGRNFPHEEATQATLSGCAAFIPGGFQGLTGPCPEQPSLTPVLALWAGG